MMLDNFTVIICFRFGCLMFQKLQILQCLNILTTEAKKGNPGGDLLQQSRYKIRALNILSLLESINRPLSTDGVGGRAIMVPGDFLLCVDLCWSPCDARKRPRKKSKISVLSSRYVPKPHGTMDRRGHGRRGWPFACPWKLWSELRRWSAFLLSMHTSNYQMFP